MSDVTCSIVALVLELVFADCLFACLIDPFFEGFGGVSESRHSAAPLLLGKFHARARWVAFCWLPLLLPFCEFTTKWLLLVVNGIAIRWLSPVGRRPMVDGICHSPSPVFAGLLRPSRRSVCPCYSCRRFRSWRCQWFPGRC